MQIDNSHGNGFLSNSILPQPLTILMCNNLISLYSVVVNWRGWMDASRSHCFNFSFLIIPRISGIIQHTFRKFVYISLEAFKFNAQYERNSVEMKHCNWKLASIHRILPIFNKHTKHQLEILLVERYACQTHFECTQNTTLFTCICFALRYFYVHHFSCRNSVIFAKINLKKIILWLL